MAKYLTGTNSFINHQTNIRAITVLIDAPPSKSTPQIEKDQFCYHCGDPCHRDAVTEGKIHFCCIGCQTVFHLLSGSGLSTYYKLENTPGTSMKGQARVKRFEHLDDESVFYKILDFYDGKNARITFQTPQIHCSSCIWLLKNLYKLEPAVKKSEVFFGKREVEIFYDPNKLKLSELATLLSRIGYDPDLNLGHLDHKKQPDSMRPLYLKIGIAGFAFGNIMLFSLPEYLAGAEGVDRQFIHLFGLLNITLGLPVFLYSSLDFFRSAWLGIRQKVWNMDIAISLGIAAMFFRSLYEIFSGHGVGYMDSFAMLVFLLLVGRQFQNKTFETLSFDRDFKAYFPLSVIRLENNTEKSIPVTSLDINDRVLIRSGELIPADATLLDEKGAYIDYSFVSGESDPVKVNCGDLIYAGGRLYGTSAKFQIKKPVSRSYLTRMWNNKIFEKRREKGIRYASERFSQYFSPAVIGLAVIAAIYWLPASPSNAINAFSAVLIIACPCALALSAPFTMGWTTNILAKNKCYIKNGEVAERLAQADIVVFDKTGTLTCSDKAEVEYTGNELDLGTLDAIRSAVHNSTHPLSRKLYNYLTEKNDDKLCFIDEYTEHAGKGIQCRINGSEYKVGSGDWLLNQANGSPEPDKASQVYISRGDKMLGYFNIKNAYREGLKNLFSKMKLREKPFLLSGDNDREKDSLVEWFGHNNAMHFNQSPENKLQFIEKLKKDGSQVVMVGDGFNDAGAIRMSDVGISIAEDTANFTLASDIIMEASALPLLDKFMAFSRSSMNIMYISFLMSVLYNIIGLTYAVTASLSPLICAIIMPISSISVILFTTLGTNLTAKFYGLRAWR